MMYNGCILRYETLFFIKNVPRLPEVLTSFRFFLPWMIPTLFQLYSNFIPTLVNYSEKPNCSKLHWNRAIISSLMYQGLDYQIIDVIQLNRAKFIFNRAKKKKPNICFARCPAVSDF